MSDLFGNHIVGFPMRRLIGSAVKEIYLYERSIYNFVCDFVQNC